MSNHVCWILSVLLLNLDPKGGLGDHQPSYLKNKGSLRQHNQKYSAKIKSYFSVCQTITKIPYLVLSVTNLQLKSQDVLPKQEKVREIGFLWIFNRLSCSRNRLSIHGSKLNTTLNFNRRKNVLIIRVEEKCNYPPQKIRSLFSLQLLKQKLDSHLSIITRKILYWLRNWGPDLSKATPSWRFVMSQLNDHLNIFTVHTALVKAQSKM